MRPLPWIEAEPYRTQSPNYPDTTANDPYGYFVIPIRDRPGLLRVVVSDGLGWDHVSVSTPTRTPTWEEMERIRKMFFAPEETVMQLHVPAKDHINRHPYCLHMWRPQNADIPMPPKIMVG